MLPTGVHNYPSYQLKPDTVYYLLPGTHTGSILADTNDAFVGGFSGGKSTVLDGRYSHFARPSTLTQPTVTRAALRSSI